MKKILFLSLLLVCGLFISSDRSLAASACSSGQFTEACVSEICDSSGISCANRVCQNSSSNTSSDCAEPACVPLCDSDSLFSGLRQACKNYADDTGPWEQNRIVKVTKTVEVVLKYGPYIVSQEYQITRYVAGNVCSTADKYNSSDDTKIRAGMCSCDSGGIYKACCDKDDITQERSSSKYSIDGIDPPYEADCKSNAYTTRIRPGTARCPVSPGITFSASDRSITAGQSTTLTWRVTGTDDCSISPSVSGASFPNDSASVRPTKDTTYTITCQSPYQIQNSSYHWVDRNLSAHKDVTITVAAVPSVSVDATVTPPNPNPSPELSCISPNTAQYHSPDHSATIKWESDNATGCTIKAGSGSATNISANGTRSVNPSSTTIYTITCYAGANNTGATATDSVTVSVRNCARESVSTPGTYVEWTDPDGACNSNYNDCRYETTLTQTYTYCKTSGSNQGCNPTSQEYASTAAGKASCEANLATYLPGQTDGVCFADSACGSNPCGGAVGGFTVSLTASPASINQGSCSNPGLSWSTVGGANCSINQGVGNVSTSGTRSVCPASTTTYTLTCADASNPATTKTSSATVTVNPVGGCYTGPTGVNAGITASRSCLPFQPGDIRNTTLSWTGTASNVCSSIIGGGSPSTYALSCSNSSSNWSGSGSGSSSISGSYLLSNVSSTQSYALQCTRNQFTCSSSQSFNSQDSQNHQRCLDSCTSLRAAYPAITSCTCSQGSPTLYWSDEAHCTQHACGTTHTEYDYDTCYDTCHDTCYDTCYDKCYFAPGIPPGGYNCNPHNCNGHNCNPHNCNPHNCNPHNPHQVCNYDGACIAWSVRYYGENQSVSSQMVCDSSDSDSHEVRFMQQPSVIDLTPSKPQILLNQVFDIVWNAVANPSGATTVIRCTPSIGGGDGKNWSDLAAPILNSLAASGDTNALRWSGVLKHLMPERTTNYRLQCRNNDQAICGNSPTSACSCYNESTIRSFDMKVFEPYLQEKSPSLRDVFSKALGSVITSLKGR